MREIITRLEVAESTATPKGDVRSHSGMKAAIGCNLTAVGEESNEMKKVWALLENCFVLSTELLVNRHLDQIILCSIYLVGKVSARFQSFWLP